MALGTNKKSDTELVILRGVAPKDGGRPYFEVTRKVENEWKVVDQVNNFSGDLKSIKVTKKYDESKEKQKGLADQYGNPDMVELVLVDNEVKESYLYKFGLRISTRSLLNSFLSLESGESLKITIGNNAKGYETVRLYQNDELVNWKYELTDIPKPFEIKGKNGEVKERDYSDIDEFYLSKVKESPLYSQKVEKVEKEEVEESVAAEAKGGDEIPF